MVWVPAVRAVVVKVACPAPFRVPLASVEVPSWNVTVPVGVPAPGATALTVAVNVTDWPAAEGFCEEITAVAEPAWLTVWVIDADVLEVKLLSPLYAAVITWLPTPSELVESVALPVLSRVRVPRLIAPSLKVTVPVAVPDPGEVTVTVAVSATL